MLGSSMLGRNMQSCTGENLSFIKKETGLDVWSSSSKQVMVALEKETKLAVVPFKDQWRIPFLAKLLAERGVKYYLCENFDMLTEKIESLCVSCFPLGGGVPPHYDTSDISEETATEIFII